MKRRDFLAAGAAASLGALAVPAQGAEDCCPKGKKELYLLQKYTVATPEKRERLEAFFADAAIPALKRLKLGPVGLFRYRDSSDLLLLLPGPSADALAAANQALLADEAFLSAAGDAVKDPKKDPLYARMESSMMVAFDAIPKLERPTDAPGRIFQLRIYEAHNIVKASKKVDMFNNGELDVFRATGMDPVFFGETVVGPLMPNLTYMLGFADEAAKDAAWKAFLAHPKWHALRDDPQYADTVSRITNIILDPAPCSEV